MQFSAQGGGDQQEVVIHSAVTSLYVVKLQVCRFSGIDITYAIKVKNCLNRCVFKYSKLLIYVDKREGLPTVAQHNTTNTLQILASPLQKLLKDLTGCDTFQDVLKTIFVVPISKCGSLTDICNYQTITIQPAIAKVINDLVHSRVALLKYAISSSQHGFHAAGGSTSTNLRSYFNRVL